MTPYLTVVRIKHFRSLHVAALRTQPALGNFHRIEEPLKSLVDHGKQSGFLGQCFRDMDQERREWPLMRRHYDDLDL